MKNKTCGECKHFKDGWCVYSDDPFEVEKDSPYCDDRFFAPKPTLTNGDKIRQMSNEGIAAFVCGVLNDRREETFRSVLGLLNAPAESEVEDGE